VSSFGCRGSKTTWKACDRVTNITAAFCALVATPNPSIIDKYMDELEHFVVLLYDRTNSDGHLNDAYTEW
jgi:hypothetical protein